MSNPNGIKSIIASKGIEEILHFTMGGAGLTGILDTRAVQSRQRLEQDERISYIFEPTAPFRKDKAWLDYVNMSISEINSDFFAVVSERWHKPFKQWWVILAFDPVVATHEGVYFTTTNNIYTGVSRATGEGGLNALFAPSITRWENEVVHRVDGLAASWTTCEQAEILYPREVSTDFLRKIYVRYGEEKDDVHAQLAALRHEDVEVIIAPERFRGRKG